jgi:hypothetical protein
MLSGQYRVRFVVYLVIDEEKGDRVELVFERFIVDLELLSAKALQCNMIDILCLVTRGATREAEKTPYLLLMWMTMRNAIGSLANFTMLPNT